jgi:hypothetical protein
MTTSDTAPADVAARAWDALEESVPTQVDDLRIEDAWATVPQGQCYFGIDSERRWHLLVPLAPGETVKKGIGARGISARRREYRHDKDDVRAYVDLACERLELRRLFALIVDDLLRDIRAVGGAPQPVVIATLDRWRQLLGSGSGLLSDKELAGLFGELVVLGELVVQHGPAAFDWWHGPEKSIHDFQRDHVRIEVKATMSHESWKFRIHGLDQLEVPDGGELHVAMLRVHQDDAGDSVPQVVDRILGRGVPAVEMLEKLRNIGYDPVDEEQYRELRLREIERRVAIVDDGFPSMTRTSFQDGSQPAGTSSVEYDIDVADVDLTDSSVHEAFAAGAAS